ncbi:MAG: hypothetical protein ACXVS6_09220 [Solirubrobacteraceae bacterium]
MVAASAPRTAELAEHNVPVPLTSLIGRSRELDGIGEVLRRTRLVTLTGPGGVAALPSSPQDGTSRRRVELRAA